MKFCVILFFWFGISVSYAQSSLVIQNGFNTNFFGDTGYHLNVDYLRKIKKSQRGYWGLRSANQWYLARRADDVIYSTEDTYSLYGMVYEVFPIEGDSSTKKITNIDITTQAVLVLCF